MDVLGHVYSIYLLYRISVNTQIGPNSQGMKGQGILFQKGPKPIRVRVFSHDPVKWGVYFKVSLDLVQDQDIHLLYIPRYIRVPV